MISENEGFSEILLENEQMIKNISLCIKNGKFLDEIEQLFENFKNQKVCLLVIGETCAGKTTFINTILSYYFAKKSFGHSFMHFLPTYSRENTVYLWIIEASPDNLFHLQINKETPHAYNKIENVRNEIDNLNKEQAASVIKMKKNNANYTPTVICIRIPNFASYLRVIDAPGFSSETTKNILMPYIRSELCCLLYLKDLCNPETITEMLLRFIQSLQINEIKDMPNKFDFSIPFVIIFTKKDIFFEHQEEDFNEFISKNRYKGKQKSKLDLRNEYFLAKANDFIGILQAHQDIFNEYNISVSDVHFLNLKVFSKHLGKLNEISHIENEICQINFNDNGKINKKKNISSDLNFENDQDFKLELQEKLDNEINKLKNMKEMKTELSLINSNLNNSDFKEEELILDKVFSLFKDLRQYYQHNRPFIFCNKLIKIINEYSNRNSNEKLVISEKIEQIYGSLKKRLDCFKGFMENYFSNFKDLSKLMKDKAILYHLIEDLIEKAIKKDKEEINTFNVWSKKNFFERIIKNIEYEIFKSINDELEEVFNIEIFGEIKKILDIDEYNEIFNINLGEVIDPLHLSQTEKHALVFFLSGMLTSAGLFGAQRILMTLGSTFLPGVGWAFFGFSFLSFLSAIRNHIGFFSREGSKEDLLKSFVNHISDHKTAFIENFVTRAEKYIENIRELITNMKRKDQDVKKVKDFLVKVKDKMGDSISEKKVDMITIFEKIKVEELKNVMAREDYGKLEGLFSQYKSKC